MRESDPETYDAVLTEAAAVKNGKGVAWRIEKPGIEPSLLFGTVHISDPRILQVPTPIFEAFDHIDTLIVELKEIANPGAMTLELFKYPELYTLQEKRLDQILRPEETEMLATALRQRGLTMGLLARMRPWFIYMSMQSSECEAKRRAAGQHVLDQAAALKALENGIELVGIETFREQMETLASVSDESMLWGLMDLFAVPYTFDDQTETLIQLYESSDTGMILALASALARDKKPLHEFLEKVVFERNRRMTSRALPYLEKGNVMIAVGALHLPGEEGLVELFRTHGFTVTVIE
ncbi:polysaccharide biosynthesis protein GumN [Agrobacterium sp. a22-2]|uniref:TraB/GumN family protein n=1 Tax=Agrobacterium sp. a22-2 TaxID=2283840 RepID=UPI0014485785|nr:TraB/GumN family protein [Agrobacterium sp. a22-2]NKN36992.1 polysaccharide biosynthesis protein GumN [Agrobacterium sp. a22-2]